MGEFLKMTEKETREWLKSIKIYTDEIENILEQIVELRSNTSKLAVLVHTDRPGLQLYKDGSGNICLETQMMPDAINHEAFENPILRPGEEFYSKTSYTFLAID